MEKVLCFVLFIHVHFALLVDLSVWIHEILDVSKSCMNLSVRRKTIIVLFSQFPHNW